MDRAPGRRRWERRKQRQSSLARGTLHMLFLGLRSLFGPAFYLIHFNLLTLAVLPRRMPEEFPELMWFAANAGGFMDSLLAEWLLVASLWLGLVIVDGIYVLVHRPRYLAAHIGLLLFNMGWAGWLFLMPYLYHAHLPAPGVL